MGVKEDSFALKYKSPSKVNTLWTGNYHINDMHFSNTTRNVLSSLFKPHSTYLKQKFYRLDDEQIKIVIDILELMEGEYEN